MFEWFQRQQPRETIMEVQPAEPRESRSNPKAGPSDASASSVAFPPPDWSTRGVCAAPGRIDFATLRGSPFFQLFAFTSPLPPRQPSTESVVYLRPASIPREGRRNTLPRLTHEHSNVLGGGGGLHTRAERIPQLIFTPPLIYSNPPRFSWPRGPSLLPPPPRDLWTSRAILFLIGTPFFRTFHSTL